MRQSIVNLVEAVRGLKVARTGQPAPHCVRIGGGDRESALEFPERLLALAEALEAFDRDGGAEAGDAELDRIKQGLDGVFRWIKLQGLSTDEPLDIMAVALGGKARKKPKTLSLLPSFTPGFGKRKTWKPKLSTAPRLDGSRSLETMAQHVELAAGMAEVVSKLGAAAPQIRVEDASSPGMGPC